MEAKLQRRVQRYGWDAAAGIYDGAWATALKPAHDDLLDMARPAPSMRVLETGCGTGLVTLRVAAAVGPNGSVFATDIADEMVQATSRRAQAEGPTNVRVERMGAENLKVEPAHFDLALCALGLMYVPRPDIALAMMRRSVKQGGRVAVTVWGERRKCGWADIFPIVDAVVQSDVCPLFFALGAPGALVDAMSAAGLKRIEERRRPVESVWRDDETMLSAVIDGGPVALAAKRFSPGIRQAVSTQFLTSVLGYRGEDGGYALPGEFVTAIGYVS
jgi:SAM-dependent methyltransferase